MEELLALAPDWKDIIEKKQSLYQDIEEDLSGLEITAYNATWCPDCERETTDLYALVMALKEKAPKVTLVSYENRDEYKSKKAESLLPVTCIPTFIIKKNDVELGRIEEESIGSFKQHLLTIAQNT